MQSQNHIKLIRLTDVETMTGMARSTIYRRMKHGLFPRPLKVSIRHVAWREQDILDWLASLPTSQGLTREPTVQEAERQSKELSESNLK